MQHLFENTEIAFRLKTDTELERANFLFEMIKREPLVRIGTAVTKFALKAHLPVEGLIRSTVFDHFCGGITEEDCLPVIEKMFAQGKVHSVLDYSVEGKEDEAQFDAATEKILKIINFGQEKDSIPYAVFKPTGFGRFALYQKVTEGKALTSEEQVEWLRIEERFDRVCAAAHQQNVPILIDAEESWMQDAADDLCEKMMRKYNTEKPLIFNTLQCYRWDRLEYLKKLSQRAKEQGFYVAMKIVRGAYMEKERERAEEKGYPSPICKDKQASDDNFNDVLQFMFAHLDHMGIFAGTHNDESSYLLMDLIEKAGIARNDFRVWFGQLYGMSDHISFNLAAEGYNVAKYVPFGPVRDVMPYLIRRAEENTSVEGQTTRELSLIKQERKRRKL